MHPIAQNVYDTFVTQSDLPQRLITFLYDGLLANTNNRDKFSETLSDMYRFKGEHQKRYKYTARACAGLLRAKNIITAQEKEMLLSYEAFWTQIDLLLIRSNSARNEDFECEEYDSDKCGYNYFVTHIGVETRYGTRKIWDDFNTIIGQMQKSQILVAKIIEELG